jgi:hypothetical protein
MPMVFRNGEEVSIPYVGPDEWPLPPPARLFWRLPIIRHARWLVNAYRVAAWNEAWLSLGYVPTGYDARALDAIWQGDV